MKSKLIKLFILILIIFFWIKSFFLRKRKMRIYSTMSVELPNQLVVDVDLEGEVLFIINEGVSFPYDISDVELNSSTSNGQPIELTKDQTLEAKEILLEEAQLELERLTDFKD